MIETTIDYIAGDSHCIIDTSNRAHINKILKYKNKYPELVDIVKQDEDEDGMHMIAKLPKDWMRLPAPPVKRNLTEEQRKERSERMRNMRKKGDDI